MAVKVKVSLPIPVEEASIFMRFIMERVNTYSENPRERISPLKYMAALYVGCTNWTLKLIAETMTVPYTTIRKWNIQPKFKRLVEDGITDFVAYMIEYGKTELEKFSRAHTLFLSGETDTKPDPPTLPALNRGLSQLSKRVIFEFQDTSIDGIADAKLEYEANPTTEGYDNIVNAVGVYERASAIFDRIILGETKVISPIHAKFLRDDMEKEIEFLKSDKPLTKSRRRSLLCTLEGAHTITGRIIDEFSSKRALH